MATGIIGVLAGSGSLIYRPSVAAKVSITSWGSAVASVNGANISTGILTQFWVGSGQQIIVSTTGNHVVLSALEG